MLDFLLVLALKIDFFDVFSCQIQFILPIKEKPNLKNIIHSKETKKGTAFNKFLLCKKNSFSFRLSEPVARHTLSSPLNLRWNITLYLKKLGLFTFSDKNCFLLFMKIEDFTVPISTFYNFFYLIWTRLVGGRPDKPSTSGVHSPAWCRSCAYTRHPSQ